MPRRRIDRFLEDALCSFAEWLKTASWKGKEHDCVNLFAHHFLLKQMKPGAAVQHMSQVRIEGAVPQPNGFVKASARRDLVIWADQFDNTWSENWQPTRSPKAIMEWKVYYRKRIPKARFDRHDEQWIESYTREYAKCLGYVVSVDLLSDQRCVYWKRAKSGVFAAVRCA